jgi:hypothetical protein
MAKIQAQLNIPLFSDVKKGTLSSIWARWFTDISSAVNGANTQLPSLVPHTTTVNGKALSADIVLTALDVGAMPAPPNDQTGKYYVVQNGQWVELIIS